MNFICNIKIVSNKYNLEVYIGEYLKLKNMLLNLVLDSRACFLVLRAIIPSGLCINKVDENV